MAKRIIICCDGTWNTPDKIASERADGEGRKVKFIPCSTNVVKIASAVKEISEIDGRTQLTYYDPGIGTEGWIVKRWFEGATGHGISKNIRDAYSFLIKNYTLGDELFLFGFSRGAFTVRSLAGLIRNCGVLRDTEINMVNKAYKLYKSRSESTHPRAKESELFRKTYSVADKIPIKFIGVWDTVGSLGNPLLINTVFSKLSFSIMGNQFHDTQLSSIVENAFQALAIDEKRRNFKPAVWQKQNSGENYKQTVEQVWFKGVHSNIGGGYPLTGLSDITLKWMLNKASGSALDLNEIEIDERPAEAVTESWKGFYKFIPPLYRKIGIIKNGFELIDKSAENQFRINNNYHPKNLKEFYDYLSKLALKNGK